MRPTIELVPSSGRWPYTKPWYKTLVYSPPAWSRLTGSPKQTPRIEGKCACLTLANLTEFRLQNRYTPVRIRSSRPHNWLKTKGFWDSRLRGPWRFWYTEFFDLVSGHGIDSGAGLVHQQYVGVGGDRARNAQPLLLTSGHSSALVWSLSFTSSQSAALRNACSTFSSRLPLIR